MSNNINFISPICPSNNHYNSYRIISGKKPFIQAYPSKEYTQYKKDFIPYLKKIVNDFEWEMINEFKHYYLDITIYFPKTSHDPTNYFKTLQDVATGILWFDDKIVLGRVQRVYYTYNSQCDPRIECRLYPVDYIGIFNDVNEYEQFISKCESCRNYKDGECKKLADYMFYKITKDFDWEKRVCLKYKEAKN
jgi:Holliday junction resolvase RusA-like endonuclease